MDDKYMTIAIKEALKAYKKNEVPVGCVIVKNKKKTVTAHAELIAINKATKKLHNWRLNDCVMYVTLQPCPMCSSAIKQSRIKKIYYSLDNDSNYLSEQILSKTDINKKVLIEHNQQEIKYQQIIKNFFKNKRK